MRGKAVRPKARISKKRRLLKLLPLLLVIAAAAGTIVAMPIVANAAYRYVSALPFLSVKQVRVTGLKYVRIEDFLVYLGDPKGSGILKYDMEQAVAKGMLHPWIKSVVARRDLPGTVRLELIERTPAAVVATRSGSYLIDADGFAMARIPDDGWEFLPVIAYTSAHGLRLLDGTTAGTLKSALDLLKTAKAEPSERLAGARAAIGEDGAPCLVLNGARVMVGRDGFEEKICRLAEISGDMQKRGVRPSMIDLRFPGKVIVKDGGAVVGADGNSGVEGGRIVGQAR
jgi:cell division septal protein FtsQ